MPFLFASLIVLAPLYVWRFSINLAGHSLPTNFLMLANFFVIAVGLLMIAREGVGTHGFSEGRRAVQEKINQVLIKLGRPLLVAIGLFGLASLISLFAFGVDAEKLAQWVVLYAQPLVIFFLIQYFNYDGSWNKYFRIAAYVVLGAAGALALVQYFTLATLPPVWWGNANEPKRAIAFFAHANAFGLFMTPLLAWLIPDVVQNLRTKNFLWPLLWGIGAAGMFFSLSRGAWLGLLAAVVVYALVTANKKFILACGVAGLVLVGVVAAVPNLRYRVLLPFHGEKSTVARFSLWDTAGKMLHDSPVLGKGVNGFSDNWNKYNTDTGLDHYNFPHNIFLNFWVDLGLLGLVSMVLILLLSAWRGFTRRNTSLAAFGLLLFIVAMVVHGLIDIPYLKNDLALVFWIVLALGL
ncbi:MAG TPA: O-antigen ligase family protein [Patescibacteria group bacterium]|jgi:O-antigen ligase|nr:O-antigen ligase family protein [Patescibacteria group bacterium]